MAKTPEPTPNTIAEIKRIKETTLRADGPRGEDSAWVFAALLLVAERLGSGGGGGKK